MKILIAEDDPVSSAVLLKILQSQPQHQTSTASDGEEAWALLDDPSRGFDLLFLDLSMPNLDGFGLIERIRGSPILKSLQIVLCTGSHDRATVLKAVKLGVRHYFVKPCSEALVLAKLRQLQPEESPTTARNLAGF